MYKTLGLNSIYIQFQFVLGKKKVKCRFVFYIKYKFIDERNIIYCLFTYRLKYLIDEVLFCLIKSKLEVVNILLTSLFIYIFLIYIQGLKKN